MRYVLRSCVLVAVLLVSLSANALLPISFGVNAGANMSNLSGDIDDAKSKAGFQAGLTVDLNVPLTGLFVQSGVSFTTKGTKLDRPEVDDYSINAMYLQVPIRIGYKFSALDLVGLNINAGPYYAYGIGGKSKPGKESDLPEHAFYKKRDTFGDDGLLKKNDFGLTVGVGAEFLGFLTLNLGYEFGLTNIAKDGDEKIRTRNGYLTVGYKF